MSKGKKNILIGLLIVLVISVIIVIVIFCFKKVPDNEKIKDEYEKLNNEISENGKNYPKVELPSNNILKYTDVEKILNVFQKKESAVIYFGYSTCLYCRSAIEVLCNVASSTNLDSIYYLDIDDVWDIKEINKENKIVTKQKADSRYFELLDILGEELTTEYNLTDKDGKSVNAGERRLYVPLVIFVVNGEIASYNKGTVFSQDDPYVKLDESQVQGLSEIYKYGINNVLGIEQS